MQVLQACSCMHQHARNEQAMQLQLQSSASGPWESYSHTMPPPINPRLRQMTTVCVSMPVCTHVVWPLMYVRALLPYLS